MVAMAAAYACGGYPTTFERARYAGARVERDGSSYTREREREREQESREEG